MDERGGTWHYGLVARWWAEFNRTPDPDEFAFYRGMVERAGQPALDLACGAGRLLLPLLRAGLDVDGCDRSPDMLARCRDLAAKEGLTPTLHTQAMDELDLPRAGRYRTIFVCDSFGIGGDRAKDAAALRRCRDHLAPGGALVFNLYPPYGDPAVWPSWQPDRRGDLPEAWPETGDRRPTADGDGSELELRTRLLDLDPLAQCVTREIAARLWRGGVLVAEERGTLREILYLRDEMLLMLERAGFAESAVLGGYAGEPATAESRMLVVVAHRNG